MIELLEHNKPTYAELCEKLESNNRVALIQATGTGKSYIIGKYIEEHCNNVLILAPTVVIGQQWAELLDTIECNVNIYTYQGMDNVDDEHYDLIVADEFHRLGSEVWGNTFKTLMLRAEKVIGATATPIRFLDKARDMSEELFNSCVVYGLDISSAIEQGVLPNFKYIVARFNDDLDLYEIERGLKNINTDKTVNELRKKIELANDNNHSIENALKDNIDEGNHKIIVFTNSISEISEAQKLLTDIFPTAESFSISNYNTKRKNKEIIKEFENSKKNISMIFTVDMLNEGIHIKDADICIMFRNTISPRIFLQQLGRVLDSGKERLPIIFDFVRNYVQLSYKRTVSASKEATNIIDEINRCIKNAEKRIIVKTYTEEIDNVLSAIREISGNTGFTEEEELYIKHNHLLMNTRELADELGCTKTAIEYYADAVGIKVIKPGRGKERIPIVQVSSQNNEIIERFDSICSAKKAMEEQFSDFHGYKNIEESLSNPIKKDGTERLAYGYRWKYGSKL